MQDLQPLDIRLQQTQRCIQLRYANGEHYQLSCEYLRVFSPSSEVRTLRERGEFPANKQTVNVTALEPVGHYAVKLFFDDGHQTGIYTWTYLYELATQEAQNWQTYRTS